MYSGLRLIAFATATCSQKLSCDIRTSNCTLQDFFQCQFLMRIFIDFKPTHYFKAGKYLTNI